jgi:stage III sporulation protein AC
MVTIALIFKIAAIAIIVATVNGILEKIGKSEYIIYTSVLGVMMALLLIVDVIVKFFKTIQTMFQL